MIIEVLLTKLLITTIATKSSLDISNEYDFDFEKRVVNSHNNPYYDIISKINHPNYNVKAQALNDIAEKKINSACNDVIKCLNDEDFRIRGLAAITLGKLDNILAIPYLINALKDEHPGVRGSAALSLGRLNAINSDNYLIELLNDNDYTVVLSACYSLGILNSTKSIDPIIKLLDHDNPQIRENAAWVLGLLKAQKASPYLEILTQDPCDSVRSSAKRAIFHIKYQALSDTSKIQYSGGSGLNIKDAIKITGIKNSLSCLRSQKEYINNFYGDNNRWEQVDQSHVKHNNKHYTLITVKENNSGKLRKFYFDITELFLKF